MSDKDTQKDPQGAEPRDQQDGGGEIVRRADTQQEQWLAEQTGVNMLRLDDGRKVFSLPPDLEQHFILLAAKGQIVQVNENFTPTVEFVQIDLKRDVYKTGRTKVGNEWHDVCALTARACMTIAEKAQIKHINTRRLREYNPHTHELVEMETIVTGQHIGADGVPIQTTKSKITNFLDRRERVEVDALGKLREAAKKADKPLPENLDPFELRKLLAHDRDFITEKDETKAFARVIRAILGIGTYPRPELERVKGRFLVVHYLFTPNYSDASMRHLIDRQYQAAVGHLFGGEPIPDAPALPPAVEETGPRDVTHFIEAGERVQRGEGDRDDDGLDEPDESGEPIEADVVEPEQRKMPNVDAEPDERPNTIDATSYEEWPPEEPDVDIEFENGPFKGKSISSIVKSGDAKAITKLRKAAEKFSDDGKAAAEAWLAWHDAKKTADDDADPEAKKDTADDQAQLGIPT